MYEFLIITGLLLFALVSVLRREYGVYLIVLLLPTYQIRFSVWGIPMTFLEGMILILAAVTLVHNSPSPPLSLRGGWGALLPIGLFLLAALVSVFVSPVRMAAAGIFKAYFFEPVLFYFLARAIIDTPKKLSGLWTAIGSLVTYLSVFGFYQFLTLQNLPFSWWEVNVAGRRIISLVNHPNALALLLGPLLAMLIFRSRKTRLDWAALLLGLPVFYLTVSRAGWLALAAAVIICLIIKYHNSPSPPLSLREGWGALLVVVGLMIIVFMVPFSRNLLLELLSGQAATQENRYVLWSAAADLVKKHPLAGVGLMGFHEYYKNYPLGPDRVVQNYPHNFFLNFWLETGLLGLVSVVWLLVLFYKKRPLPLAAAAGMTVIILHGLVDVPYFKNDLSILFWFIYALSDLPGLD